MLNFFAPIGTLGYGVYSYSLIRAYDEEVSAFWSSHPALMSTSLPFGP